jgi:hypothetical protein
MVNKKILVISIFILIVLSIGAVSAEDADDAIASSDDDAVLEDSGSTSSGTASGGVDVVTENPWATSGQLEYDIPANAKTIKSADVYVNVYGGSASPTYGANANITITTENGGPTKYNESLWTDKGTTDGAVYTVNNHTTKCYSDYMIHYNITSLLTGLNGTKLSIKVDTFKMGNLSFDGRIKLIGLVFAYNDDSDNETISYWINDNQLWTKSNTTLDFDTAGKSGVSTLTNVVLSSGDGTYTVNDKRLIDVISHESGNYYQYNKWDVSKYMEVTKNTSFNVAYAGSSAYGSIKNVLSVLTINDIKSDISVAPEYVGTSSGVTYLNAFAGTNNTLTVTVSTSKSGKYLIRLLADGVVVNETEAELTNASKKVLITDPTVRPVDNTTVNGAENQIVNYTVELLLNGAAVNSTSMNVPILYNGYLGKDLAYPAGGMETLPTIIINGDIVADVKTDYLSGDTNLNKTDVWTLNLDENSTIVKAFVYVPYTWCAPSVESPDMFNVTFNNEKITPIALYRDQSNLGGSGRNSYGVLVYDVTSLVNKSGDNALALNKSTTYPGVYSSAFVYMYNVTSSNYIKEVYINHGADLLYNSYNDAKRPVKSDSKFVVDPKVVSNATLYVFASNAQNNYADLVFNGETYKNIFADGGSYLTKYSQFDVTGKIKASNSVSVVGASKGTFLALHQIMVLTKNFDDVDITLTPEYTSVPSAYAGTNNAITVTIEALKAATFNATLLADGSEVAKSEIDVVVGTNKFVLIDPTIRPVDASTINGADNKKVNYTLQLSSGKNATIIIPLLYNGNLGKDLAYPAGGMESFLNVTINGDIVIDVKDVSSYLGSGKKDRTDIWSVDLDAKSSIVKSFIYVPYNWFNGNKYVEDESMFNVTFNGANIAPVAWYRDQGNLGGYGKHGYGVFVYDVTGLTKSGDNSLVLVKKYDDTPAVYPSVLIYMYNTTGSAVIKNVYITNGADLLAGTSNNVAKRPVYINSTIDVKTADTADLYIFAASAQSGEGNLVFNGVTYENIWSGTSSTTDLYTMDITASVENSNNISFVATGSTILALQQIIVTTQKAQTTITAPEVTTTYNTDKDLVVNLKDSNGNGVANAKVVIVLNGVKKEVSTNADGQATLAIPSNLVPKSYDVSISYAGDGNYLNASALTKVIVKKASVKLTAKKKTFKAKVKTKKYTVTLKDNKGKAMSKVKLTLKIKGKKAVKATTNKKGKATFKIKKLTKKGKYNAQVTFKGDKYFNKATKKIKIKVKK